MGRKTKRQLAKEEYERYESEWLKTHDKTAVDDRYAVQVALHCEGFKTGELRIEDTSNYYLASLLACALYSKNEGTDFYRAYLARLYEVMPKDKVDMYVFGGFENEELDRMTVSYKYNELEYVEKYRKRFEEMNMLEISENISPEALDFALRVLAHLEERCEINAQHLVLQDGSRVRALRMSHAEQVLGAVKNQLYEEMKKAGDYEI